MTKTNVIFKVRYQLSQNGKRLLFRMYQCINWLNVFYVVPTFNILNTVLSHFLCILQTLKFVQFQQSLRFDIMMGICRKTKTIL